MIYEGDNWPAEYRGHLFTLNFHGRRVNHRAAGALEWKRLRRRSTSQDM